MSNSNNIDTQKKSTKKGLGRGLGSLLGAPEEEASAPAQLKSHSVKKEASGQSPTSSVKSDVSKPLEKVEFQAEVKSELKEGFTEEQKAVSEPTKEVKVDVKPAPQIPDTARIWQVPIEKLKGNPNQPRKDFDSKALGELADSIKNQGILQPIVARKLDSGEYQIIAGERRWRASQQAGLHEVPVVLKETNNQKALELALIENIQRENLNPMEEAEAYEWFLTEYELTQQALAEKIGKDRVSIANSLRLLKLHPDLRTYLRAGELSSGQAKVLLGVEDPSIQKKIGFQVLKKKLTVRETEKLVAKAKKGQSIDGSNSSEKIGDLDISTKLVEGLSQELQKILGTRVAIDYKSGKGKVKINFYSDSELDNIVDKLRDSWKK